MRWDHLHHGSDRESHALPGMQDPAVLRRFDAPEALDMRFYEIQAKTVLNRVPGRSAMPFGWTVNPYRGCSHACSYCLDPATPVLLADGRTKPIGLLEPGDAIYGTHREGAVRRYVETAVVDRWSTRKPAFAVLLEDGTRIVASGDHRFLTADGWCHVADTDAGTASRPHLRPGSRLLGPGGFAPTPEPDAAFRQGYVCATARGSAYPSRYARERTPAGRVVHRSQLAEGSRAILDRTRSFLAALGASAEALVLPSATVARPSNEALDASLQTTVDRIRELIAWPDQPDESWHRGFLAGMFDLGGTRVSDRLVAPRADGTFDVADLGADGAFDLDGDGPGLRDPDLRIIGRDHELLRRTTSAAHALGFDVQPEATAEDGTIAIRFFGGLAERLRFVLTVDPAVRARCGFAGEAVEGRSLLRIRSIEPLGERDLCDITTGTGDFLAAGVVSHNCFARPTHEYLGFDAGRDFEREIVVKVNAPERLRADLAKRARTAAWDETVALGTNTDPYQWVESRYRLMPGIWEALRDARVPASVLTKSPLLLRDLDLMLEVRDAGGFEAALSIPSLDERAWRSTEPHTPHPKTRLAAVAELNRVGIPTAVLAAPLMPGINDAPAQVEALLEACRDAGATSVRGIGLHLRGSTRDVFLAWLADERPELVPLYEQLYAEGPYLPRAEAARLSKLVQWGEARGPRSGREDARAGAASGDRSGRATGDRDRDGQPADARRAGSGRFDDRSWSAGRSSRRAPRVARPSVVQESLF